MNSLAGLHQKITIAYGSTYSDNPLWVRIKSSLLHPREIKSLSTAKDMDPALLLLDLNLLMETGFSEWREAFPDAILLCPDSLDVDADLLIQSNLPFRQTSKLLEMACFQWVLKKERIETQHARSKGTLNLGKLADIGISLSAESDLMTLLQKIVTEGQNIACCDAASFFLVEEIGEKSKQLRFKLTQNDSMKFSFEEATFPADNNSIAGYVAITNKELNVEDAHHLPPKLPFRFNRSFDRQSGYRTKSVYTIPLTNKHREVMGVLQFINREKARALKISNENSANAYTLPFDNETNLLLQALASQAGIAIENTLLYSDIKNLFEGFVNASVAAIEQRDPTTSGHSFRVADLCVGLARSTTESDIYSLRRVTFSDLQIQELRYAALLHDFGKVGVREQVLVKAKKLRPGSLEKIQYRILLAKERVRTQALTEQIHLYRHGNAVENQIAAINSRLDDEIKKLTRFYEAIIEVNEPSVLANENRELLHQINDYKLSSNTDELQILTESEFQLLNIPKGSLSTEERKEIESHVVHTQNFLKHIPWTKEFRNIPDIAAYHHEKMDGSGYPYGLTGKEIPVGSKIMTVCDIYDALTASDRPYKPAINTEKALDILNAEAKRGLLDVDLVNLFIEAKTFSVLDSREYKTSSEFASFSHHPCDYDLQHDD
ncbi:MAG: HD domain-containing phosphohydrolase [Pseudohongiellaceae bacterium]